GKKEKHFTEYGNLDLYIPTAQDSVAPIIAISAPTLQYMQSMQQISATISDSFGRIDPASISAVISGTTVGAQSFNQDVTSQLQVTLNGQGDSATISGTPSGIPNGSFTLVINGSDLAGNAANPATFNFFISNVPPVLSVLTKDNVFTSNPLFELQGSVQSFLPATVSIFVDGNLALTASGGFFDQ